MRRWNAAARRTALPSLLAALKMPITPVSIDRLEHYPNSRRDFLTSDFFANTQQIDRQKGSDDVSTRDFHFEKR